MVGCVLLLRNVGKDALAQRGVGAHVKFFRWVEAKRACQPHSSEVRFWPIAAISTVSAEFRFESRADVRTAQLLGQLLTHSRRLRRHDIEVHRLPVKQIEELLECVPTAFNPQVSGEKSARIGHLPELDAIERRLRNR
jgi:hypothetical protein